MKWKIALALLIGVFCNRVLANSAITVTDYNNQSVTLQAPAKRIIALAPHIVENLYSAGAGKYLVGAVDYCDYPQAAKSVTRVGSISSHSIEVILGLQPDLVIAWDSGHGGRVIPKLRSLGIPVYASNPKKLEDVARSIRDYGALAQTATQANSAAEKFMTRLRKLDNENRHKNSLSVLYEVWNNPLQTLNDEHIISDLIKLCGASNAFGDAAVIAPKISLESVLKRNPDAIVASGMGDERPDWLDDWKRWPSLKAVHNKNLFYIPPDIIQRHTARILEGATQMCEHLDVARSHLKK